LVFSIHAGIDAASLQDSTGVGKKTGIWTNGGSADGDVGGGVGGGDGRTKVWLGGVVGVGISGNAEVYKYIGFLVVVVGSVFVVVANTASLFVGEV
jgi:hypothetical protein